MNPTWLQRWRDWRAKRRAARAKRRHNQGYDLAMRVLHSGEETPESLYNKTEMSQMVGDFDDFDRGVRVAIYDFEKAAVEP